MPENEDLPVEITLGTRVAAEGSEYEPIEEVKESKNHDRESWQVRACTSHQPHAPTFLTPQAIFCRHRAAPQPVQGSLGEMTTRKVAIGPRSRERRNQFPPLRFLLCARPALISARVNQPTA
jgi:hypothetical protein